MSFFDYSYPDGDSDMAKIINVIDNSHNINSSSSFQEKNEFPIKQKSQFDYSNFSKENYARRKQQLQDLRANHAKKRASLAVRFGLMSPFELQGTMPIIGYDNNSVINGSGLYKKPWQSKIYYDIP